MINAQEARNIATRGRRETYYNNTLDFLDKKIRTAAQNGYVSITFQAPSTMREEVFEEIRKALVRFGYTVKVWEEQKQMGISW